MWKWQLQYSFTLKKFIYVVQKRKLLCFYFLKMINLQRLEQAFNDRGEWIETVIEEPCRHNIRKDLFSPEDFSVKVMSCLTAQGRTSVLIPVLKKKAAKSKYIQNDVEFLYYKCIQVICYYGVWAPPSRSVWQSWLLECKWIIFVWSSPLFISQPLLLLFCD